MTTHLLPKLGWYAAIACVSALLGAPGGEAHAQLAKRGSYTGKFAFYDHNATVVTIEPQRIVYHAIGQGPFFNDAESGFLHLATVSCPGRGLIDKGSMELNGYCVATDRDGDKALLKWSCTDSNGRCAGTFDWMGGTGKYVGMKGRNSFEATGLGQAATSSVGYATWKGEWELP